jgi:hypothetical protein
LGQTNQTHPQEWEDPHAHDQRAHTPEDSEEDHREEDHQEEDLPSEELQEEDSQEEDSQGEDRPGEAHQGETHREEEAYRPQRINSVGKLPPSSQEIALTTPPFSPNGICIGDSTPTPR